MIKESHFGLLRRYLNDFKKYYVELFIFLEKIVVIKSQRYESIFVQYLSINSIVFEQTK